MSWDGKAAPKRKVDSLSIWKRKNCLLYLPYNDEINVQDIYVINQVRADLFVDENMTPYGIAEGTLFLLRDGTMRYSDAKPEGITMKSMAS